MNWRRVYGMLVRHYYATLRSYDRLTDSFYWISIDLILWGLAASYMQDLSSTTVNIFFMIVASVILWNIVYRNQADIGVSLLDELWNKNLINLFASPLTFREWVTSLILLGVVKTIITLIFGCILASLLYHFDLLKLSWTLIPFFILLTMNGWWIGCTVTALILRFSTKVQAMAWTFVWLIAPFSAIYYPLSALPPWARVLGYLLPTSYVFEELRNFLLHGELNSASLWISFVLNVIYLFLGILFLRKSFDRVLNRGLLKVY